MDIEHGLRAHLIARAGAPIPADLTARLASRMEPRRRSGRRANGRKAAVVSGGLAAVLVAAFVMYEVATVTPTHSGPALATGSSTQSPSPSPSPTPSSALLAHPIGSTDVILSLRMVVWSGALPISASARALDQETLFVLYGDGTAVFDVPIVRRGGHPSPEDLGLFTVHLDEEQVVALLQYALGTGGLRAATTSYSMSVDPRTDAVLKVDALGVTREISVTDPGAVDPNLDPVAGAIRTRLGSLVKYLQNFGGSSYLQEVGKASPYRADRYLAVLDDAASVALSPPFPGRPVLSPWPWPDVLPSAFHTGTTSARTLVITPRQYDTLLALPTSYGEGFGVRGPDKKAYVITARPLLPNEPLP
jgi:hypothetical protein